MKIYTKNGDKGSTQLVNGTNVSKSHERIDAYGTLDELNSHVGLLCTWMKDEPLLKTEASYLESLQNLLFNLGSQLACDDSEMLKKLPHVSNEHILEIEKKIDAYDAKLPALKNFILPGGHKASAQAHICRTLCRRCERLCVGLNDSSPLPTSAIPFLNRLSDFFFTQARFINFQMGIHSPEWKA